MHKPIHIIGLGGAGSSIATYIHQQGFQAKYSCISHPVRTDLPSDIHFIHFIPPGEAVMKEGKEIFRHTQFDVPLTLSQEVTSLFNSAHDYIIIAGLGGYTGTHFLKQLSLYCSGRLLQFRSIGLLPLWLEGDTRKNRAREMCEQLQTLPNFAGYDQNPLLGKYNTLSLQEAFDKVSEDIFRQYIDGNPVQESIIL